MDKATVTIDLPTLLSLIELAQQAHAAQGQMLAGLVAQLAEVGKPAPEQPPAEPGE